jgi:hypothetical protein
MVLPNMPLWAAILLLSWLFLFSSQATPIEAGNHVPVTAYNVSQNATLPSTLNAKPFTWSCLGDSWAVSSGKTTCTKGLY